MIPSRAWKWPVLAVALAGLLALAGTWIRVREFRSYYHYDVGGSYAYAFDAPGMSELPLEIRADGFSFPALESPWDTAFLSIDLESGWPGLVEPEIILRAPGRPEVSQFLERGARGRRLLNLSFLADLPPRSAVEVRLEGRGVRWTAQSGSLLVFRNRPIGDRAILVVAPHPDDAEIAAFGLYAFRDATIVTVSAGDAGGMNFGQFYSDPRRHYELKGRLRVWDSIAVPLWGGVPPERAINLGYSDGTLATMHANPRARVAPHHVGVNSLARFRRQNRSSLLEGREATPSWPSLVGDLAHVIRRVEPDLIVLPHPLLDAHPDHQYTAVAVLEALERAGPGGGEIYLYANHSVFSELVPFGPPGAWVSLSPWFDPSWAFASVYSHPLSPERRVEKTFALEAMHDLRGAPLSDVSRGWVARLRDALHAALRDDRFSYFRRAVRPNEIFFVHPVRDAPALRRAFVVERRRYGIAAAAGRLRLESAEPPEVITKRKAEQVEQHLR